jgi:hypothetical protein
MFRQERNPDHQRRGAEDGDENVEAAPEIILEIHRVLVRLGFTCERRVVRFGCFQFAHKSSGQI